MSGGKANSGAEGPSSRIESIRFHDFKGFVEAQFPLGELTLVVGTNASGKSNLRDGLRFLHGLSRGYTIAETVGEKWIEGGVLQWRGIRGGIREAAFNGENGWAVTVSIRIFGDDDKPRSATYLIAVLVDEKGHARVGSEMLKVEGRGEVIYDSHPLNVKPPSKRDDVHHFSVRLKKTRGYVGKSLTLLSDRPALGQLIDATSDVPKEVRGFCIAVRDALASIRFLDLVPEAMRIPSLPGQQILGDRGENLSSVLLAICEDEQKKRDLILWTRQLTPLDVTDLRFVSDQTGKVLLTLVESDGRETSAYSASDGTLRFLALVAAFLGPHPARLYFFEELETGLHPTRLSLLLELIEGQTRQGRTQVIATTHSPQLLSFLSAEAREHALLTYRLPGEIDQRVVKLSSLPNALESFDTQGAARLFASGWFEDMASFMAEPEDGA